MSPDPERSGIRHWLVEPRLASDAQDDDARFDWSSSEAEIGEMGPDWSRHQPKVLVAQSSSLVDSLHNTHHFFHRRTRYIVLEKS